MLSNYWYMKQTQDTIGNFDLTCRLYNRCVLVIGDLDDDFRNDDLQTFVKSRLNVLVRTLSKMYFSLRIHKHK